MTTYDKSEELSGHDIATTTVDQCFNDFLDGSQPNLTLRRGIPFPNKEDVDKPTETSDMRSMANVSVRRPAGKLHAHLVLGEKPMAHGEYGIVLEASIDVSSSSPELARMKSPPLVVKICRPKKYYKIPREAFYYEYMESLQGSVIPRYYGLFQLTIPEGVGFKYWPMEKSRQEPDPSSEIFAEDSDDEDHIAYPRVLTLLILERLGDPPSDRTARDDQKNLKSQAHDMLLELSDLHILHGDVHSHNIVMAAPRLPDFPNLPSPRRQRTYDWRLIDFSLSFKTDLPEHTMTNVTRASIDRLFSDLRM